MIHPSSEVKTKKIGEGTNIWQFVVILEDAVIGSNCNINAHVFIENSVSIGQRCTIKSGVQIWDGITLEDDVFIGPNATFTNDINPRSKTYKPFPRTLVKKGASIGANATILPGITIGEFALIGAGSVVTKDVPAFTVWRGNPAKLSGYVTRQGELISLQLTNKKGQSFELKDGEPIDLKSEGQKDS